MFDNLLRELRALERRSITVPIDSDEKGYIDKECPSTNCEFQFKIKDEDWKNICRDEGVWCPMCGHAAPAKSWFTKAQVRHAERHAHRVIESTIDGAMRADARAFNGRQPRNSLISMSMKVVPAAASAAMELEIACEKCSCRFAVIGSAYFCPACGHSSVDRMFDDSLRKIRAKKDNVEVVRQAIAAVGGRDEAELMCRSLIESCLQDGVTAFQRCCEGLYASTAPATPAPINAFQRLAQGSELWQARVGVAYVDILGSSDLERLRRLFQKRHLLAHSDGIVDQRYINESGDPTYKVGQRITVSTSEVDGIVIGIGKLVAGLRNAVNGPPDGP
jgi:uncharacterized Zn finger protein (UPF0148 family)